MINIGFVGFSDETRYDKEKAVCLIDEIFKEIKNKYFKDNEKICIISGATNCGIPRLVYEKAVELNKEYNKFIVVGVMAKEGYQFELFPCDVIYAVGNSFGEESKFFVNKLDVFYKIGGGAQSENEILMAKNKKIPCFEYIL